MRLNALLAMALLMMPAYLYAQLPDSVLQEVTIHAYSADRPALEVPAPVVYIGAPEFQRFNNTSFLPVINTAAGVRMEERSPGSYRFSIRGSSIRSPFGIRNVKMYWNGLPLTDGGGNTYLNLLDFSAVDNIEIIKGPAGSLYGAGTGGVVLLNTAPINTSRVSYAFTVGSFGLQRHQAGVQLHAAKFNGRVQATSQEADGYRDHSAMQRKSLHADFNIRLSEKSVISPTILYSDLFYQTPGGLTQTQYDENPQQARPGTPALPGAVERNAAVYNKTFFAGFTHDHQWNNRWLTQTAVYFSDTDFKNPTIRNNYEHRREKNAGLRLLSKYLFESSNVKGSLSGGGELQYLDSPIDAYDNIAGEKGNPQASDELTSQLMLLFAQADLALPGKFFLTAGISANFVNVDFTRTFPAAVNEQRNFDPVFLPRIAVLRKMSERVSLYAGWSRGFSPPTIAELYPSRQIFDTNLSAESGNNVEVGAKGSVLRNRLTFDVTFFEFKLSHTIVSRRDFDISPTDPPEFFVNAGNTTQRGIEIFAKWQPIVNREGFVSDITLWSSYAYNHFRFEEYLQGTDDHSGNKLTGAPPTTVNAGLDISFAKNIYIDLVTNYTDHIPLNDANSVFASEYFLLGARLGYKAAVEKFGLHVFAGVDNALDKRYSLGNDLNAAGGRYFNTAPERNFYVGIKMDFSFGNQR